MSTLNPNTQTLFEWVLAHKMQVLIIICLLLIALSVIQYINQRMM